jgi:hypothetical protein
MSMRGDERIQDGMFSYVSLEQRVPADHPLRGVRKITDGVLRSLSPEFDELYADSGRRSIAPENILRALLLQVFFSIRSERLLVEQIDYNLLFRWFVGLAGVKGFRFHDCRHHAITELAESQASDATIMALAGHVSRKMLEHYSHVRQEAKRDAVNVLSAKRPKKPTIGGYDTIHDTRPASGEKVLPYVVERMVSTRRLELLTSTVSKS